MEKDVCTRGYSEHDSVWDRKKNVRYILSRFQMDFVGVIEGKNTTITHIQNNIAWLEKTNKDNASTHTTFHTMYEANKAAFHEAGALLLY